MKKAYTLIITLILLVVFSLVANQILENSSLGNESLKQKVLYIQAKNHLKFLEEYILSLNLEDIESINNLKIDDDSFEIKAQKSKEFEGLLLDVKSFDFDIRVTKKLIIK
ncbi:hypothetical protein ACNSOO_10860 [Aliarcobacter lanthieri]|uniref:hypothetical protein n=1 Tax=Aliarcobacter lanthieri TaxID=1355374 RepID=UPI00047A114F|nr:hypothetical protein [Aliarcobacter lanthieri]QKF58735.1 hypothetical protein ALANTH_0613 [Aliarcobacter lanthieri]